MPRNVPSYHCFRSNMLASPSLVTQELGLGVRQTMEESIKPKTFRTFKESLPLIIKDYLTFKFSKSFPQKLLQVTLTL